MPGDDNEPILKPVNDDTAQTLAAILKQLTNLTTRMDS